MPGVVAAEVYVEIGGHGASAYRRGRARRYVLAFGADRRDAEERASRALAAIHIETE